jgi:hypothetical protein
MIRTVRQREGWKMRHILIATALLAAGGMTPAAAQDAVPDLKGTWNVTFEAVGFRKPADGAPTNYARTIDASFSIDWQEGARLAGREIDQTSSTEHALVQGEQIVGVIGWDNATLSIVDDNGLHDCRILSPDSMQCIYRHILPERSDVARSVWTKQR